MCILRLLPLSKYELQWKSQLPYVIFFRFILANDYVKWNCKKQLTLVIYVEIHEFMQVNTSYTQYLFIRITFLRINYSVFFQNLTKINLSNMLKFDLRYIAICHPMKRKWHFGKQKTVFSIFAIWLFSLIPSCCWTEFTNVSIHTPYSLTFV